MYRRFTIYDRLQQILEAIDVIEERCKDINNADVFLLSPNFFSQILKKFFFRRISALFQEYEEHGQNQADEGCEMVPLEPLSLEHQRHYYSEDGEGDDLLYHFQLHEGEWPAVAVEPYPVCRHLGAVLEKCYSPREQYDEDERPA